ncbi:MAG: PhnD/SsuA/transferrin family substrate-binding protein [Candidatus Electryonea clarkiae]|nr:PhnD/SsuA/transferrin family substrate-binding protein [Candidatus Electryonea clarkiae]MDP8287037.1 PhnD/SsuA/transferrin family substrate-binding protein [Candidatus Electryonea clarkiae]
MSKITGALLILVAMLLTNVLTISDLFAGTQDALKTVRIGVLAKRGAERCLEKWNPTAQYLTREVSEYTFEIVPLDYNEIYSSIEQKKVDFILANSSYYVGLEMQHGVSRIATLKNLAGGKENTVFGGVIFARSDRTDFKNTDDFKNISFITVHQNALGAWHSVWFELEEKGFHPFTDFSNVQFAGSTHDSVVYAVRDGLVDIGAVRSGTLERMEQENRIKLTDFHVFRLYDNTYPEYPYLISTRLYPEWPIARLPSTSIELAEQVASALLKMSRDDPAAIAAGCGGWTIPLNYQSVHYCLKRLHTGPYEEYGKVTFNAVLKQYWHWMFGSVILVIAIILFAIYVSRLNRKLKRAVVTMEEVGKKRNEAIKLAEETSRLSSIGVMAAGITHEINQPLNAIRLSADGIILWSEKNPSSFPDFLLNLIKEISSGSKRISEIIEHMRSFWVTPVPQKPVEIDMNEVLQDALELIARQIKNHQIELIMNCDSSSLKLLGDPVQFQQIINNLVINAIYALDEVERTDKKIRINTKMVDKTVILEISDNGPGLSTLSEDELFDPFYSTRIPGKGMGLGLAIVKMFVNRFNGKIEACNNKDAGATFSLYFPAVFDKERI